MHRVAFTGASGSGKTTAALDLAKRLGVPFVDLEPLPLERATETIEGDGWVSDATHQRRFGDLVLRYANTVIWLDFPLSVCARRVAKRENPTTTARLLFGAARARQGNRTGVLNRIRRHPHVALVRLRSQTELDRWLSCS